MKHWCITKRHVVLCQFRRNEKGSKWPKKRSWLIFSMLSYPPITQHVHTHTHTHRQASLQQAHILSRTTHWKSMKKMFFARFSNNNDIVSIRTPHWSTKTILKFKIEFPSNYPSNQIYVHSWFSASDEDGGLMHWRDFALQLPGALLLLFVQLVTSSFLFLSRISISLALAGHMTGCHTSWTLLWDSASLVLFVAANGCVFLVADSPTNPQCFLFVRGNFERKLVPLKRCNFTKASQKGKINSGNFGGK